MNSKSLFFLFLMLNHGLVYSQSSVNYDESAIEPYKLPELLISSDGNMIESISAWEEKRRPEILKLFENEVYGKIPEEKLSPKSTKLIEQSEEALSGKAIRRQTAVTFSRQEKSVTINILLYLPKGLENPPIFIGYNFFGNHSITDDKDILLTNSWIRNNEGFGITENQATEASRGMRKNRWPIEKIIDQGYGLAAIYYGDVDPDRDNFSDGIHQLFYDPGQSEPTENDLGSIAAWAWGYSRVLDYLEKEQSTSKFILFGHSRLGKTALWAGALDTRFDMIISNNSGCGGAALSMRKYGETVGAINSNFPHWFADKFNEYSDREEHLPVDQHMLIALMAPRPVYIASAEDDQWADPTGEYLSGFHASPVYELYGKKGLTNQDPPPLSQPIHESIGYHIRPGKHDVTDYDWEQYMAFAKKHLK